MATAVNGGRSVIGQAARTHKDYRGKGVWKVLHKGRMKFIKDKFPGVEDRWGTTGNWKRIPALKPSRHIWNVRASRVGLERLDHINLFLCSFMILQCHANYWHI